MFPVLLIIRNRCMIQFGMLSAAHVHAHLQTSKIDTHVIHIFDAAPSALWARGMSLILSSSDAPCKLIEHVPPTCISRLNSCRSTLSGPCHTKLIQLYRRPAQSRTCKSNIRSVILFPSSGRPSMFNAFMHATTIL